MNATLNKTTDFTLILDSKILMNALALLGKNMAPNVVLPVLENVLVEVAEFELILTTSDLRTNLTTRIACEKQENQGKFLLPYKISLDLLRSLPATPVKLTHKQVGKTCSIVFYVDDQKFSIASEDAIDFPKTLQFSGSTMLIPTDQMKEALINCLNTVSTDDLKPHMMALCFDGSTDYLTIASTSGHALISYETTLEVNDDFNFILPSKSARIIADMLDKDSETICFEFSSNAFRIDLLNCTLVGLLIDERFPDYKNAIPVNHPNSATLMIAEWKSLISRALLFSNKTTKSIRHSFSESTMELISEDLDYVSQSNQSLAIDGTFENTSIGFNGEMIQSACKNVTGQVKLEFGEPNRAMLVYPENTLARKMIILIMPVMLNTYV